MALKNDIPLLLKRAADGDESAASLFFTLFPELIWHAPSRGNLAEPGKVGYPNDLYGFLAVKTQDYTIAPIFSDASFAEEWSGRPIHCRQVTGRHVMETLPDEWWIGVNPGQEVEKEISPWEITLLKKEHPEAIKELVRELFEVPLIREISTRTPDPTEYAQLVNALRAFAHDQPAILELFLLERLAEDIDENQVQELLLGASLDDTVLIDQGLTVQDMQTAVTSIAEIAQIGAAKIKVFTGVWGTTSIALLSFAESAPFYNREPIPSHE
jgi:hypothetical protein